MASKASVGAQISLDGEKSYKQAIKDIVAQLKSLQAEQKKIAAQFEQTNNAQRYNTQSAQNLSDQIQVQQKYIAELTNHYQKQVDQLGIFNSETLKTKASVEKAEAALADLNKQLVNVNALDQVTQKEKLLASELDKVKAKFELDGNTKDKNAQTTKILSEQVENAREKVKILSNEVQQSASVYGENSTKTQEWKQKLNEAETELYNFENQLKNATGIIAWGKSVEDTGNKIKSAGDRVKQFGDTLTIATSGITAAMGAGVKNSVSFEKALDSLKAKSGATSEEIERLKDFALELSETQTYSAYSAEDLIQAFEEEAKAGWSVNDIIENTTGVLDGAAASGENLEDVTSIVVTTLNSFRENASAANKEMYSAADIADILVTSANAGIHDVADLGESLKYVGATAGMAGYSLDDVATALTAMASNGVKGSQAGTGLAQMLRSLSSPTDKASAAMKELGISVYDASGNYLPLNEIISQLRTKFSGLSDEQLKSYESMIFTRKGVQALDAILATTDEDYQSFAQTISGAYGSSSQIAQEQTDNLSARIDAMKNSLNNASMELVEGFLPTVENIVTGVSDLAQKFSELDPKTQDLIAKAALFVGVAGPVLSIGGRLISGVGTLVSGVGSLASWIGTTITNFGGFTGKATSVVSSASSISDSVGTASNYVGDLATNASSAGETVGTASVSFGQLAGQALKIVALGAGLLLAGEGFKLMAQGASEIGQAGPLAAVALGEMVVGLGALLVTVGTVGTGLTAASVGMLAFGASVTLVGGGVLLASTGLATLAPNLSTIGEYGGSSAVAIAELSASIALLGAGTGIAGAGALALAAGLATLAAGMGTVSLSSLTFNPAIKAMAENFTSLSTASTTATSSIKTLNSTITTMQSLYKTSVTTMSKATSNFKTEVNSAVNTINNKLASISVTEATNKMVSSTTSATSTMKKTFSTTATSIKGTVSSLASSITSSVNSMNNSFNKLSISNAMNNVVNEVNSSIRQLQNIFSNTRFSFNQNIALPHFSMSGSFNAKTKRVPTVHVSWYKKAYDQAMMFTSPTVLPTASGYKGFGDGNGNEIVLGENYLRRLVSESSQGGNVINVTVNADGVTDPNELADIVADKIDRAIKKERAVFV